MRPFAAALLALVLAAPSAASQTTGGRAATPDLSPDVEAAIDGVFVDLDRTDVPGCAAGVVMEGTLVFADGWGSANLDHELPITPHTVFYMGSVSKQFTAGAVALAARRGHLSLDDDVREWFPELPDYGDTIRVRHLIHHTSGIRDYLTLQSLSGSYEGSTDEQILELLARQRGLNFPPGERELYSNSGYFLLSELIERATGMTLREYAEREFLGPLGMRSSHFHDDPDHVVRYRATGYRPTAEGFEMNHAWSFAQVGSGGLYSNVEDMARWEIAWDEGRIGPPGFRDALLERGVLSGGDTLDYAFGVSHGAYRGVPMVAHGGSLAGFRAHVARFPDQHTAVVVLCNVTNADPGRRALAVADAVLADRLGPPPAAEDEGDAEEGDPAGQPDAPDYGPDELEAFTGRYASGEVDLVLTVERVDDGLEARANDGSTGPLRPVERDVFSGPGYVLRFQRDAGRVTGFLLDAGRANGIVFERVEAGG